MTKRIFTAMLALALAVCLPARAGGDGYSSALLRQSAEKLGLSVAGMQPLSERTFQKGGNVIVARTDELGDVEHIGVRLFAADMRQMNPLPVYDYVEFSLMNHLYGIDEKFMRNGDVVFTKGSWERLAQRMDNAAFSVMKFEDSGYRLTWTVNGAVAVEMEFPILYDHLARSTMAEMEERFMRRVAAYKEGDAAIAQPGQLRETAHRGVWQTAVCDTFQVTSVSNTLYYNKRGQLIFDKSELDVSLTNLMLTADKSLPNKTLRLTPQFKDNPVTLSLRQFAAFARYQRLKLYIGVKAADGKNVSATLYAVNREMGYFHMFMIDCSESELMMKGGALNVRSQLYVPIR